MQTHYGRLAASIAAVIAVALFVFAGGSATSDRKFMNGSLSIKHQALESSCNSCHEPWEGVKEAACLKCHKDKRHLSDIAKVRIRCVRCHREHRGKSHNLALAGESRCALCHGAMRRHRIKPAKTAKPDENAILFTHLSHIKYGAYDGRSCGKCHKSGGASDSITSAGKFEEVCGGKCHYLEKHDIDAKKKDRCVICHSGGAYKASKVKKKGSLKNYMHLHKKHESFKCVDCHENLVKAGGDYGSEAMDINLCFDCHKNRLINLSCVSCHDYHAPSSA